MCVQTDEFGDSEQAERGGSYEKAKAGKTEICFSVFLLNLELSMNRQGQFQMRSLLFCARTHAHMLKPGRHWHFYVGSTATFFSEVGVGLEISKVEVWVNPFLLCSDEGQWSEKTLLACASFLLRHGTLLKDANKIRACPEPFSSIFLIVGKLQQTRWITKTRKPLIAYFPWANHRCKW